MSIVFPFRVAFACTALLASLFAPESAAAYRTVLELPQFSSATQPRITWNSSEVTFLARSIDFQSASAISTVTLMNDALANVSCTNLHVDISYIGGHDDHGMRAGDGQSVIYFVTYGWENPADLGLPANKNAVTEIEYEQAPDGTWSIVEADILINVAYFNYYVYPADASPTLTHSLPAVLVHEIMHAVGLLHVCELDGSAGAPTCASDASYASRTMYPTYTGHGQSMFSSDEVNALCDLYPSATCQQTCPSGEVCAPGGCAVLCGNGACEVGEACVTAECRATCGGATCGSGDVCIAGECRDACNVMGMACPRGTLCLGLHECSASCVGAPCDTAPVSVKVVAA